MLLCQMDTPKLKASSDTKQHIPLCHGSADKESACNAQEMWVQSLGQEDPLEKEMQPTSVFLPVKPMDRGAWWATVQRVTKSRTRLSTQAQQQR